MSLGGEIIGREEGLHVALARWMDKLTPADVAAFNAYGAEHGPELDRQAAQRRSMLPPCPAFEAFAFMDDSALFACAPNAAQRAADG